MTICSNTNVPQLLAEHFRLFNFVILADKNYDQGTFLTTVTSAGKHIMSFVTSRQTAMTSSTSYPDSLGKDPGLRDCGKFYLIGDCYAS